MNVGAALLDLAICVWLGVPLALLLRADAKEIAHHKALARAAERLGLRVRGHPRALELSGTRDGVVLEIKQIQIEPRLSRVGPRSEPPFHSYSGRARMQDSADWVEVYRAVRLDADNLDAQVASLVRKARNAK